MCLPIGLGLWGSYSDIAHGLNFGHCLLLFPFSSPSWVLSKEKFSGFPNLMRFYSALSALLFIEISRRRAHNWCSPEQMFFREGCCLQTVPKISVTSREIWGQVLVFYRLNAVTSTFIRGNSLPAGHLPVWEGEEKAGRIWYFQTAAIWRKRIRFLRFQPTSEQFYPTGIWQYTAWREQEWKDRICPGSVACWEQERAFICVLNDLLEKSSY